MPDTMTARQRERLPHHGTLVAVRGSVVDAHFPPPLPPLNNRLLAGEDNLVVIEVASHVDAVLTSRRTSADTLNWIGTFSVLDGLWRLPSAAVAGDGDSPLLIRRAGFSSLAVSIISGGSLILQLGDLIDNALYQPGGR